MRSNRLLGKHPATRSVFESFVSVAVSIVGITGQSGFAGLQTGLHLVFVVRLQCCSCFQTFVVDSLFALVASEICNITVVVMSFHYKGLKHENEND